jgi:hypothetical protein
MVKEEFNGLDILTMIREPLVKLAWSKLTEAVREAGASIFKNPREMAMALRMAAGALDKYADEKEGKKHG